MGTLLIAATRVVVLTIWDARSVVTSRRRRPGARRGKPRRNDLGSTQQQPERQRGPVGADVHLEISTVAHGGVFVARHEGRVIFVSDAIPGERVLARISEATHDRFWRADTIEVVEASPDRQPHVWSAAAIDRAPGERAGGAEFGHIALERQRALKGEVIADALSRMARIDAHPLVQAVGHDDATGGLGWRTRVRLQVDADGRVGPFAARSHHVVPVTDLPLAVPGVAAAAPLSAVHAVSAEAIEVVAPSVGEVLVLPSERRPSPLPITERVGDRLFRLDARGFWQVHTAAPATLTRAVQSAIDGARFDPAAANLDLYGGVGLLAAAVADRFGHSTRITSVESASDTTDHAAENLADWIGASAVTDSVERYLDRIARSAGARERDRQRAATIVLDPPRSGAGRAVVDRILALAPAQVIYVACDPVAFARDAALFAADGYAIRGIEAFDLFPHTHHVELVAALAR